MFADLQKNIHREIGTLMGQMLAKYAEPTKVMSAEPNKCAESTKCTPAVDMNEIKEHQNAAITDLEKRIMAAIEQRLPVDLESRIMSRVENRLATPARRHSVDSNEEAPVPQAPSKGQTTLAAFTSPVRKIDLTVVASTPVKNEIVVNKVEPTEDSVVVEEKEEAETTEGSVVEEEEEEAEATSPEGSVVEEEEAEEEEAEEEEAEEEEAEELTEFMYKGTKYFMDSECNVYGLTADGELNDEPVGTYNTTTRRITFVAA